MHSNDLLGDENSIFVGLSRDLRVTLWSPGAASLFGMSDAVGHSISQVEGWGVTAADMAVINRLSVGDYWSLTSDLVDRDGMKREFGLSVSVAADPRGSDELLMSWTLPESDVAMPSRELRYDSSMCGPFALVEMFSGRLVTQYCAPAFQTRLNLYARDVIGRPSSTSVHPDDRVLWQLAGEACVADPSRSHYVEVRRRSVVGGWRFVGTELTNMLSHPDVRGIVGNSHDLTGLHDQSMSRVSEQSLRLIRDGSDSRPKVAGASIFDELFSKLSKREVTIVVRLLNGDRVPDIAESLFVSQSTVRNQLASVFRKARVSSQQDLIRLLKQSPSPSDNDVTSESSVVKWPLQGRG